MRSKAALLCAVMLLSPLGAHAVRVNVTGYHQPPAIDVSVTGTSVSYTGPAGLLDGVVIDTFSSARASPSVLVAGPEPTAFLAFTAELTQTLKIGVPYDYAEVDGVTRFGADKAADLSRLLGVAPTFVTDAISSAAFQVALWEIIYETGPGYDLGSGAFTGGPLTGDPATDAAFAQINTVLGYLDAYAPTVPVNALTNPTFQDLLVVTIPEPGSWALMLAGLGACGFAARRRRAAGSR